MGKKFLFMFLGCVLGTTSFVYSQVGIGTDAPNKSSILDVTSTDKGVLLPRVALTSATDQTTISNPAIGLLVYNTGSNTNFTTSGYMFWDGTAWKIFTSNTADPATASLSCSGATMSPGQQITGSTPIIDGTILQIPYTGGNGGSFNGVTLKSVGNDNVTATLASGMLTVGAGVLNFELSGVPTASQQAPAGITFDLTPLIDANSGFSGGCTEVTVGNLLTASIESSAVMGYLAYGVDNTGNDTGTTGYSVQADSPNGKFSARVWVNGNITSIARGNQNINIQVRNNTSEATTVIWNYCTVWSGGMVETANMFTMPSMRWGGTQGATTTWTNASSTSNAGYWGDPGIYDGTGPEYRRYTWIPLGEDNKVSYEIHVMCALDTSTPTTAVSPTKLKVYIKFDQVTAM